MSSPNLVESAFQSALERRKALADAAAKLAESRQFLRLLAGQEVLTEEQSKAVTLMFPVKGSKERADWDAAQALLKAQPSPEPTPPAPEPEPSPEPAPPESGRGILPRRRAA